MLTTSNKDLDLVLNITSPMINMSLQNLVSMFSRQANQILLISKIN